MARCFFSRPLIRFLIAAGFVSGAVILLRLPAWAGGRMAASLQAAPKVSDVALGPSGELRGQVVTRDGTPAAGTPIMLFRGEQAVARTQADEQGSFAFGHVAGGVYVLAAPSGGQICRAWSPGVAPPAAAPEVLVVTETAIVRGQTFCPTSLYEWFETHPLLGYTAVTAAIAVPIILITQDDDAS
jgi:hypothetical protein